MRKEGEEIEEKARGEKVKNPSGNGDKCTTTVLSRVVNDER